METQAAPPERVAGGAPPPLLLPVRGIARFMNKCGFEHLLFRASLRPLVGGGNSSASADGARPRPLLGIEAHRHRIRRGVIATASPRARLLLFCAWRCSSALAAGARPGPPRETERRPSGRPSCSRLFPLPTTRAEPAAAAPSGPSGRGGRRGGLSSSGPYPAFRGSCRGPGD